MSGLLGGAYSGTVWVTLVNKTGAPSVLGSLVSTSPTHDRAFSLQSNEYDTIGVVATAGVADGQACRVIVQGPAQVLFKDGVAPVRGSILLAADTDGRANQTTNPGTGLPAVDTHFKECGHVNESLGSGTDVLAWCCVHFN